MSVDIMGRFEASSPTEDELEEAKALIMHASGNSTLNGAPPVAPKPTIKTTSAPNEGPQGNGEPDEEEEVSWDEWLDPKTGKEHESGPVRKSVILRRAGIKKLPPAYALLADLESAIPQKAVISEIPVPVTASSPPASDRAPAMADPIPAPAKDAKPTEGSEPVTGSNLNELDELLEALNSPALLDFEENLIAEQAKDPPVDMKDGNRQSVASTLQPTPSSMGSRPDVNHLLDELQSVVSDSDSPRSAPGSPRTASSATRDLDALMASLRDFEMNSSKPAGGESPVPAGKPDHQYAQPHKRPESASLHQTPGASTGSSRAPSRVASNARLSQLDSMIGHLQSDISRAGISTSAKGTCSGCQKSIVGQVITALGRTWHPEHFTCVRCDTELAMVNFFERDGKAYCEKDYHETFAPQCAHCNGPIVERCMSALGKTFHPEHFFCAHCGKVFGTSEPFHERDGRAYCREDYYEQFAPKCGACNRAIAEAFVTALGQQWHPECFNCMECGQPFKDGNFLEHDGQPYCEKHYHINKGSSAVCFQCKKTASGRVLTAMGRKYHAEHFVCSFCLKQLNMGTFKEQKDRPYCMSCYTKLFG